MVQSLLPMQTRGNVNFADGTATSNVNENYKNLNDKDTTTDYVSSKSNESAQSGVLVGAKSFRRSAVG